MIKAASQIAQEVILKTAAEDSEGYGSSALQGAGLGAATGGGLGAALTAPNLIAALRGKHDKVRAHPGGTLKNPRLRALRFLLGGALAGAGAGGAIGAGIGAEGNAQEKLLAGDITPSAVGTQAGAAAGVFAPLANRGVRDSFRNPLTMPIGLTAMGLGGAAGTGIGLGAGKLIEKLKGAEGDDKTASADGKESSITSAVMDKLANRGVIRQLVGAKGLRNLVRRKRSETPLSTLRKSLEKTKKD